MYYEDAKGWIEQCGRKFDVRSGLGGSFYAALQVIIMDICDPIEAGPGEWPAGLAAAGRQG